jgi:hypothetical protein
MKKEKDQVIKNYKYWSGYNEFYCNGRVMLGPRGLKTFSLTFLMINLPTIVIYVFAILV